MTSDSTSLKRCTKCGVEYSATSEFFYLRDGHIVNPCKYCARLASRRHNAECPGISDASRKYREEHVEQVREWSRRSSAKRRLNPENKEKEKASRKVRNTLNHEDLIAKSRAYYAANKDKERARSRQYQAAHRDEIRDKNRRRNQNNPERTRIKRHRRNARLRALPATFTAAHWAHALEYFNYCCAYCGRPQGLWRSLVKDHYIPLAGNGGFTPDNILPACQGIAGCNNHKSSSDPVAWVVATFGSRRAKKILARIQAYFDSLPNGDA